MAVKDICFEINSNKLISVSSDFYYISEMTMRMRLSKINYHFRDDVKNHCFN